MSGTGYAVVAIALLVVVGLLLTFDAKTWIGKGLRRGDLHSLLDVATGLRPNGLSRDQAQRLQSRGMVRAYGNGNFRATLKGRLALQLRRAMRDAA